MTAEPATQLTDEEQYRVASKEYLAACRQFLQVHEQRRDIAINHVRSFSTLIAAGHAGPGDYRRLQQHQADRDTEIKAVRHWRHCIFCAKRNLPCE